MKFLFKIFAFLSLLVFGLVALVWFFPGLVLNDKTLALSKRILAKEGIEVDWQEGKLSAASLSFNDKKIALAFTEFCLKVPSVKIEGCFSEARIELGIAFQRFSPKISYAGPIQIKGRHFLYEEVPSTSSTSLPSEPFDFFSLPRWLTRVKLENVDIQVENAKILTSGLKAAGSVALLAREENDKVSYDLRLDAEGEGLGLKGEIQLTPTSSKRLGFLSHLTLKEKTRSVSVDLEGHSEYPVAQAKMNMRATNPIPDIQSIALDGCEIELKAEKKDQVLTLNCPLNASVGFARAQDLPYTRLIRKLDGKLAARLHQTETAEGAKVDGKAELWVDPLFSPLKEGTAHLVVTVEGKTAQPLNEWNFQLDSKLAAKDIRKVSRFLTTTAWAFPEPFAELEGPLELQVQGKSQKDREHLLFPLNLTTRFSSKRQKLDLEAKGDLKIAQSPKVSSGLSLDVSLQDIQLILPPLDPYALPRPLPDTRIEREPPSKLKRGLAEKSQAPLKPFEFSMRIKVPPDHPVRFLSSLSEEMIPIVADLNITPEAPLTGSVEIKPFSLTLFRRNAHVQNLRIGLKRNPDFNVVSGKVDLFYADYTVSVLIDGLLRHPNVHFVSDPPLSDKQLIAVLLFGREIDALDSDEVASVGNTRSALADGAVGLASMYVLASTPVESVGYDNVAKEFSAKIKLADKTSVTIGTDLKQVKTLGLRRKLSSHWDINSYLENPFFATERSLTTFLEWNWRY